MSGSLNYQSRIASGWVESGVDGVGYARFVSEEPHHANQDGAWVYVQMHNAALDEKIARIVDGIAEKGEKVGNLCLRWKEGEGTFIVRTVGGEVECVKITDEVVDGFDGSEIGGGWYEDQNGSIRKW